VAAALNVAVTKANVPTIAYSTRLDCVQLVAVEFDSVHFERVQLAVDALDLSPNAFEELCPNPFPSHSPRYPRRTGGT